MPIPNKAGEPDFKLKVEPADKIVIKFKMNEESIVPLTITNPLKDRICYKVKCTDNEIFRVRPPLGFIDAGKSSTVKISLKAKAGMDTHRHFFAIYHLTNNPPANQKKEAEKAAEKNCRALWKPETKPDGVIRLQAVLENEDEDKEKKEEEKEEKKEEKKNEEKEEKKEDKKEEKKEEKEEDKKEE
ncbi:Major sperm protein [Caenorhabditis elegans]|uniref:Major sperm protein n=1 Tax=Caenorhabditis elegans TaxID=6239 RepID=Q22660_CAEEL|nr:Major sperm protein [Caenorhabditis elegans]CAA92617.1 Major sperm protein [Caenorhabditis elegans]|eukprot:NP_502216.1 Major sperm protein [Caenorhabditis elegans]